MEEEVALPMTQAPSSLDEDGGPLKEALMEVENISTPSNQSFIVEATYW